MVLVVDLFGVAGPFVWPGDAVVKAIRKAGTIRFFIGWTG